MGYYGVNLLRLTVEIDILSALFVAAGAGFLLFLWPLFGVVPGVLLEYFALLRRFPGDMHKECFSPVGRSLRWPA